jgi:hypothetical protein
LARKSYEGRRRAEDINPEPGKFIQPVRPSTAPVGGGARRDSRPKHLAPEDGAPAVARTRTPKAPKAAAKVERDRPRTPPAPTSRRAPGDRTRLAARAAAAEGHAYALRQAHRATTGKPSVTGRAVAGGAAGAATGATIGSVVPVVGTAAGTGAGAVIGSAAGGIAGAKAKRAFKAAMRESPRARQAIVAEFAVCMVVAGLSPLTDQKRGDGPGAFMRRMTALMGVFFILGLVSTAGRGAAKAAAAFGGLVTLGLLVSERNLFVKLAGAFGSVSDAPAGGPGPSREERSTIGRRGGSGTFAAINPIPTRRTAESVRGEFGRGDLP